MQGAAHRAAQWVTAHQRTDGTLPARPMVVESCYKGLWALVRAGYPDRAMALADRVAEWVAADGDVPQPRSDEAFLTTHYLYANAYLALGAHVLGRFDLSRSLYGFVRSRQTDCGGFLSQGPGYDDDPSLDTVSTSIAGLTAIYLGDVETGVRAARFIGEVWERQPEPEKTFYSTTTPAGELVTAGSADEPHRAIDVRDPEQDWYFIGIATVFLPALHEATGDPRYLDLARELLDYLGEACSPGAFTDASSGKSGVGAAHVYRLTGEQRYRDIATRVAQFLIDFQDPSGCWREEPDGNAPSELAWSDMDMTVEYVLWLGLIAQHLSVARA